MRSKHFLIFAAGFAALVVYLDNSGISRPPGVMAPQEPYQRLVSTFPAWKKDAYVITPVAEYQITARVLGIEHYWFDSGSSVSPIDLALGWGPMSDSSILSQLEITQGGRWYEWRGKNAHLPLTREEINSHSANVHIVPATAGVKSALGHLWPGSIVSMEGMLVNIDGPGGATWKTSLSRTDTGPGACELLWVTRVSTH